MRRGTVYPPSVQHTSTRLSQTEALSRIDTYLTQSETQPHLHPDALIEPGGINLSRTSGGPSGGIVMHHLRRIRAGLNGETLALDAEELSFTQGTTIVNGKGDTGAGNDGDRPFPKRWKSNVGPDGMPIKSALKSNRTDVDVGVDDAVDGERFAQQQDIVEGEYNGLDGAPVAEQVDGPPDIVKSGKRGAPMDKEGRKADKKARRHEEKRAREEARKAGL